jgi:hypothetical protein
MATLERLAELTAKPQRLRFFHYSCGLTSGDPAEKPVSYVAVQGFSVLQASFDAWRQGEEAAEPIPTGLRTS